MSYNRKRHFAIRAALEKQGKWDPKKSKYSASSDTPQASTSSQPTIPEGNERLQISTGIQGCEETPGTSTGRCTNPPDQQVRGHVLSGDSRRLSGSHLSVRWIQSCKPHDLGCAGNNEQTCGIDPLCRPGHHSDRTPALQETTLDLQRPRTPSGITGTDHRRTERAPLRRRDVCFYTYDLNNKCLLEYAFDPSNVCTLTESAYYSALNPLTLNSWLGAIFTCSPHELVFEVLPHLIPKIGHFIATRETSSHLHAEHYHFICATTQRTDNFYRAYTTRFPHHGCCKVEKVKSLPGLLRYICKDPDHIISNNQSLLHAASIAVFSTNVQWNTEPQWNAMTKDITEAIKATNSTTLQELLNRAPTVTAKYLHRSNLQTVFQNCKLWMLNQNKKKTLLDQMPERPPDPRKIHGLLRIQKINTDNFDADFYSWATQQNDKKNTLILHGPSNTGKTSFIRPLIQLYNYGEAHNENIFSFTGCAGRDIILWEEPIITTSNVDLCKLIFEGSSANLPHKFKDPIQTNRTPVAITTNKHVWHFCSNESQAIKNRSYIYSFTVCHDSARQDLPTRGRSSEQPSNNRQDSGRRTPSSRSPSLSCRSPISWRDIDSGDIQSADYIIYHFGNSGGSSSSGGDDDRRSSCSPITSVCDAFDTRPTSSSSPSDNTRWLSEHGPRTIGELGAITLARYTTELTSGTRGCVGRTDERPGSSASTRHTRSRSAIRPVHGNKQPRRPASVPATSKSPHTTRSSSELCQLLHKQLELEADQEPKLDRPPDSYDWLNYISYIKQKYE